MKRLVSIVAFALATSGIANAAEGYTNFNYGSENPADQTLWGTLKQESYDVAMRVTDPAMVGKMISEISVPVVECAGIEDYSIWLSGELNLENKVNMPDVASWTCSPADGLIKVSLDSPVEIPENGIYVGYSFVMTALGAEEKKPLVVTEYTSFTESFFIHTNRSYKSWKNLSESKWISPVINVVVNGDFPENSVDVVRGKEINMAIGEGGSAVVALRNSGGNPVNTLQYSILIDGKEVAEETFAPSVPLAPSVYNASQIELPLPWDAIPNKESGDYKLTVEVNGVNSTENTSAENSAETQLNIMSFIPVHRPIVEEYTGTWCGYCPRGYVGLEIMSHIYPNDFIGISYHSGDDMEVIAASDYPNEIIGYPDAWLDRVAHIDAYSGYSSGDDFGVDKVWESFRNQLAPADITITASFTDNEETVVGINAMTTFAKKSEGVEYRQVFMLLGNGMTKEYWFQSNNYYGEKQFLDTPYAEYWEQFVNGGSNVRGVIYNDILLAYTDIKGEGHGFPADFAIDEALPMSHTFVLSDVVNMKGEEIVQDKNQLYAVVLLVNAETGAVENANKVKVDRYTGAEAIKASSEVVETVCYDLTGRRVVSPQGMCVLRTTYADGTVKVEKKMTVSR